MEPSILGNMKVKQSWMRQAMGIAAVSGSLVLGSGVAVAGNEREDLQRQIDAMRAAVQDFDRLDERRSVSDEIALLRSWLDEAWARHSAEKWRNVREILDRCVAQQELIRQKITASKLTAQAADREAALKQIKEQYERLTKALEDALVKKRAMEMNAK